jgi:hypothetical protein
MSSLIFFTDSEQALIATDTLAVSPDGQPLKFTTKAFALPHLRMVIAGTGAGASSDIYDDAVHLRTSHATIREIVEDAPVAIPTTLQRQA